jgi:hypothetical protein
MTSAERRFSRILVVLGVARRWLDHVVCAVSRRRVTQALNWRMEVWMPTRSSERAVQQFDDVQHFLIRLVDAGARP